MNQQRAADGDGGMADAADWRGRAGGLNCDLPPPAVEERQRMDVRCALLPGCGGSCRPGVEFVHEVCGCGAHAGAVQGSMGVCGMSVQGAWAMWTVGVFVMPLIGEHLRSTRWQRLIHGVGWFVRLC